MVFGCEMGRSSCPRLSAISYPDLSNAGFSGAMMDPVAALVLCTPGIGNVDISVINGKIVVKDGKLTTIDLKVHSVSAAGKDYGGGERHPGRSLCL